jgi:hypothetical protein
MFGPRTEPLAGNLKDGRLAAASVEQFMYFTALPDSVMRGLGHFSSKVLKPMKKSAGSWMAHAVCC